MSPQAPVKIILGTHTIGDTVKHPATTSFDDIKDVEALLDIFYSRGGRELDTGRNYEGSEERLGLAGAASRFVIHSKARDGPPGSHEPAKIAQSIAGSMEALKTPTIETYYLHVPDRQTPFEDTAKVINEGFREGKFRKFGLSNYSETEVEQFLDICEREGYVKPSVYQGHYNAIARGAEKPLFPVLRKHNISFYAYSPAAAGIFNGNSGLFTGDADKNGGTRWTKDNQIGQIYSTFYGKPAIQAAVTKVIETTEKLGISGHAAALRWTAFHSILDGKYGDAVIFGVSKQEQLYKTLDAMDAGPLPAELADAISAVYATLEGEAPPYHL